MPTGLDICHLRVIPDIGCESFKKVYQSGQTSEEDRQRVEAVVELVWKDDPKGLYLKLSCSSKKSKEGSMDQKVKFVVGPNDVATLLTN